VLAADTLYLPDCYPRRLHLLGTAAKTDWLMNTTRLMAKAH